MGILGESLEILRGRLGADYAGLRVQRLVAGLFFTGVKLSSGAAGVCFTPVKDIPQAVCCPSSAGRIFNPASLAGLPAGELLAGLDSPEPLKRAAAIAGLNALHAMCLERGLTGAWSLRLDLDAQDAVEMGPQAKVAVVGALVPTLRALKARGGPWWVVEQDPRTLKGQELERYVPAADMASAVGQADLVFITGTTLVTQTLEPILAAARPQAKVVVLGPTSSMSPEPLFARGADVVGGVWVRRPDELLEVLAAGGSGYHFFDSLAQRIVMTPA
ncbi:MAG: Fis family transcriptional regulator [Desulfarculus sp.]|nr:MAG: Fis family transcriptional regulator [Desulfarculus sp.]